MPDQNLSPILNGRCFVRRTRWSVVVGLALFVLLVGTVPAQFVRAQETVAEASNRQVNVVLFKHFPPQYQLDKNGDPTGFAVDVMDAVAARAGLRPRYIMRDTGAEVIDELLSGRVDVIPNIGIAAGREETMAFTAPVETFRVSLFIRDDTQGIASLDDLAGKEVGVVETNVGQKIMANRTDARVTVYPHYQDALFALLAGTVDAFIFPEAVIWRAAREARVDSRIKTAGPPLLEVKRAIAVRKDNAALLALLAPAVDEFLRTEQYQKIYSRWYGSPTPFWSVKRAAIAFGALLIASIAALFLWRQISLHRLNQRLRESEDRRRLFMDSATEYFVLYDANLNVIDMNASLLQSFGRKKEDVLGRNIVDVFPDSVTTGRIEKYRKVLETGEPFETETAVVFGNGRQGQIIMRIFKAGNGLGVSSADITEWKKVEAALRESEETLRLFLNSATEDFALFDRDLRLLTANAAALAHFGLSAEQATGKALLELVPHMVGTERYEHYLEVAKTGRKYVAEVTIPKSGGQTTYRAVSAFPANGGVGLITRDITEQKRAELALESLNESLEQRVTERTAELRAAQDEILNSERLAALGQLTATVAHELRNPLATIRTSVFSLRSAIEPDAKGPRNTLQRIDRNIARCDRIISELLDFSANREPHLETVDLNQCIAAWVEDYEASEGVKLRVAISADPATARIDQDRIHQVIVNLVENASQAYEETPGGARTDDEIAVRTRVEGNRFILEVADDGPGIPADVLPRIFEPLFSTRGFGVGLGLPLVKKIVDRHGGTIEVETGVGDGTTFRISLPLDAGEEAAA